MAPPDHDTDHGERIAVVETVQQSHADRLRAIDDKIWWAMVAVVGTAGSVLWQLVPSFIKGLTGK